MDVDILVVGGGPIGAATARWAAEAGASVLLVDRRAALTTSSCCAGLISPRTLDLLGASSGSVLQEICAVTVHAPGGRTLDLTADQTKALVLDRLLLEQELHRRADAAGVEIRLGTEAVSAHGHDVTLHTEAGDSSIRAAIVIGADGPSSRVAEDYGLPAPAQFVQASQVVAETEAHLELDQVEVFLGASVAPGFFAWSVPLGTQHVRVGVGVVPPASASQHLERLLDRRFPGHRVIERSGGPIPIAPSPATTTGPALLVGDAAGQVKPLSGGGLYTGGTCARIAARLAAAAAQDPAPEKRLHTYDRQWRTAVGREIAFGRSIRRVAAMLSDRDLDTMIAVGDDREFLSYLAEHADIDQFHRLPDRLSAHPALWRKALRLLPLLSSLGIET